MKIINIKTNGCDIDYYIVGRNINDTIYDFNHTFWGSFDIGEYDISNWQIIRDLKPQIQTNLIKL